MLQTACLYVEYEQSYSQKRLNQSKSSILFIAVSMVTLNLILKFTIILDLISFPMLQTRPLYLVYEQSYSQNRLSQSKYSILVIAVSMVTLNLILKFTNILDLISFPMLQTRPLYLVYEQSYSQNRLSQSKYSILVIAVSMVTLNLILKFTNILDLISFPMLQTACLYRDFSQSYSQNRLNQSKYSISDSIVTIATIII